MKYPETHRLEKAIQVSLNSRAEVCRKQMREAKGYDEFIDARDRLSRILMRLEASHIRLQKVVDYYSNNSGRQKWNNAALESRHQIIA